MINKMPRIALGTWQITDPEVINKIIPAALNAGYKHIDTAELYKNEHLIGNALANTNIKREDYWITTKIFHYDFDKAYDAVKVALKKLKTNYIDTMLLHVDVNDELNLKAYKQLMKAREEGLIRSIGVSNWNIRALKHIYKNTGEYPAYNQIICSVRQRLFGIERYCEDHGIILMAYSSARPYYDPNPYYPNSALNDNEKKQIDQIAKAHNTSPGVILLAWAYHWGYVILPKSTNPTHIVQNLQATNIKFSEAEIKTMELMWKYADRDFVLTMKEWKANYEKDKK